MTVASSFAADLRSESVRSLYDKLIARQKDINHINGIGGILHWDQEVMMPSKAAAVRAEQRMVGLGKPFWTYALPLLKEQFPDHEDLQTVTVDQFYNAFNRVEPRFIRTEADEVTYPMQIILRYEIEKALVEGNIQVADVPRLWNAKMKEYLGLEVTEDRLSCLQDVHWSFGFAGYFPTYSLGSIYAVQIFTAAKEAIPGLDEHLAKGEFHVLKEWLNEKIHVQGSLRESGDDLVFDLTGKHLDSSLYVKYLTEKYSAIYDL